MACILVPMDGSETALRALDRAIERLAQRGGGEIRLVNVQPPIPSSVGDFVGAEAIDRYHAEEGEQALREAKERLASAGAQHTAEVKVGNIAETIADSADETGCDEIVMGGRGRGRLSGYILGSVATRVLDIAKVPVTIVK